jgi:hypothetical protein
MVRRTLVGKKKGRKTTTTTVILLRIPLPSPYHTLSSYFHSFPHT